MNKKIIAILVLVIGLGFGYYWYGNMNRNGGESKPVVETAPSSNTQAKTPEPTPLVAVNIGVTAPKTVIVRYTSKGFSPSTITITKGDTVSFVADANSDEMWIASNPHPTHEGYDGTTRSKHCAHGYTGKAPLDECSVGTSYNFTFDKIGTWKYHNHGNVGDTGTVVVK